MARGDGGGDNTNKLPVEHASAGIKPEYASFRPDSGASGVNLDRRTDEINAANRSLDGTNPYSRLTADDASVALAHNEAAIKATMDRIAALGIATQKAQGRGQADDLLGQLEIRT
jgi:hypothetical protein